MKRGVLLAAVLIVGSALTGCTRVETGNVGIVKDWGGKIEPEVVHDGATFTLFKTVTEIDATQTRVQVNNLTPKDQNGVPLSNVDVIVTYTLEPENAAKFYMTTHELDTYTDESHRSYTTLGLDVVKTLTASVMQKVTEKDDLASIARNSSKYEQDASVEFKKELDARYPGAFKSVQVTTSHFTLPDAIQKNVNDIASMDAERQRNEEELKLVDQRTELAKKKAQIDADALRSAADIAHLTPEQVIAWRNANALYEQAQNIGGAQKVVDVTVHK